MQINNSLLEILRITAPFGINGAVRVILYTNNLEHYSCLFSSDGKRFKFHILKLSGNTAILKLDSIINRNMAESMRGQTLYIKKDALPKLSGLKFYICDLLGRSINVLDTNIVLKISDIVNFGAGDLIELSSGNNSTFYVPFTKENFPEINSKMYLSKEAYEWFKN